MKLKLSHLIPGCWGQNSMKINPQSFGSKSGDSCQCKCPARPAPWSKDYVESRGFQLSDLPPDLEIHQCQSQPWGRSQSISELSLANHTQWKAGLPLSDWIEDLHSLFPKISPFSCFLMYTVHISYLMCSWQRDIIQSQKHSFLSLWLYYYK